MESMDTVSLQAVTLADGSTAYIQHDSKASFSDGQIMDGQVIQLEDGSAAYVQHVSMPKAGKCTSDPCSTQIPLFFYLAELKQSLVCFPILHSLKPHMQICRNLSGEIMFSLLQEGTVYSWRTDKQFS